MPKKIGVIGLGSIGMRHARNLIDMGHRVMGYDPAPHYKELHYPLEQVMRDSEAIVIASPTTHHAHDMAAAILHKRPYFVEKPIANDASALDILWNPTMVGYNLRFHSCVKKAKEWLDAGLIGDPIWANFTCAQYNDKPAYLRDGVILNWSHEIDLAFYLLGPAGVAGSSTRYPKGHDDLTDILLSHTSGCATTVHLDYLTEPEQRYFSIIGTRGNLFVNLIDRCANLRTKDKIALGISSADHFFGNDSFDENYKEEMKAFIDRIDGKETIGCTGKEALEVLNICLEVRKQAGL